MSAIHRKIPLILFSVTLMIAAALLLTYQRKPEITSLSQTVAAAGDSLEIHGRHFGNSPGRVYFGQNLLTSVRMTEWTDTRITVEVPRNNRAVLVRVRTNAGTSDGVILGDSSRFPEVDYGPWLAGAPFIEYAGPSSPSPGTLVTLQGEGFGNRRGSGKIWVSSVRSPAFPGFETPDWSEYAEAPAVSLWTDNQIQFWLPQKAVTGNIYLTRGSRFSNPVPVEVDQSAGQITKGDSFSWSLRQDVLTESAEAGADSTLYLYVPSPHPGTGQEPALVLNAPQSPKPFRQNGNLSVYRLDDLDPGKAQSVSRQMVVTTNQVSTVVNAENLQPFDGAHPELAAALGADEWIQPDQVSVSRITGNLQNDWQKSVAIYNYVTGLLSWTDDPAERSLPAYLSAEAADSEGYAFLLTSLARAAGIPARPVGGLLVPDDGQSRRWWWSEIWIQGVGWVPADAALQDSPYADISGDYGGPGSLEGRHIAFSRGILPASSLQPESLLNTPEEYYTLQEAWEALTGSLENSRVSWPVPRVTAVY